MKKYIALPFLLCCLLSTALLAQSSFKVPPYEKFTLPNGLTVYLMEQRELPLIYVSAVFPAGADKDGKRHGLASLTADALLFGTRNYTKTQIDETVEFLGASLNTYASQEAAYLSAYFNKKDKGQLFSIIRDVITAPVFDEAEFNKYRSRVLVQLEQQKESPRSVIGSYFNQFMYADHVYGNPVQGMAGTVSQLSTAELKAFYQTAYLPNGAAIAIAGDFKAADMKKEVSALFKDWKKGSLPTSRAAEKIPAHEQSRVLLVNKDDARESTFYIGAPGVSRNNPDFVAIEVVNTILGGRFTSWLNDELRVNSGLTYGANSRFSALRHHGTFAISTFTKTATTIQAIDLALEVLNRLHSKGIDETTLSSAKNYVKGQFPPRYETAGQLANLLTAMFVYNFDEAYINTFQQKVEALDVAKVKEIVARYFPKDKLQFVIIGKASEIEDKVSKYGTVSKKEIKAEGF